MNFLINVAILILCALHFIKTESHYEYTDKDSGTYFNFSKLKRETNNPWTVRKDSGIFAEIFRFNFGQNVEFNCRGKQGAIAENTEAFSQPTPICSILGDFNAKKVELINKQNTREGIIVEYGNGDVCQTGMNMERIPKVSRFYLYCNNKMDLNVNYDLL